MKKIKLKHKQVNTRNKAKSRLIINASILIILSLFLIIVWINQDKNVTSDELIEIKGQLISYDYRYPGNRGVGIESKLLFLKLDNYRTEFKVNFDYSLFKEEIIKSSKNEIKTYVEPKNQKWLNYNGYSDVETFGLYVNGKQLSDYTIVLKNHNKRIKYIVPIFIIILLVIGLIDLYKFIRLRNNTSP